MREQNSAGPWGRTGATRRTFDASNYTNPERLAEIHGGRRISDGKYGPRWLIRCPAHEDKRASAVLFIGEDGGLGYICYAGCSPAAVRDALGLNRSRNQSRRGPSLAELEQEAIRLVVAGTRPTRFPPYTRELPRVGVVTILIAADRWPQRLRPALVLPPGHPPALYRWPVARRQVSLIDLASLPQDIDHRHGDWRHCPVCWGRARRDWLRAFAALLIGDHGATAVRVVSEAEPESVLYQGVQRAA